MGHKMLPLKITYNPFDNIFDVGTGSYPLFKPRLSIRNLAYFLYFID